MEVVRQCTGAHRSLGGMRMPDALNSRTLVPRRLARRLATGLAALLAIGGAGATVPTSNELGVRFKVLRMGTTASIEIRLTPRRDFDAVSVEAGSGVASMTNSCTFSNLKPAVSGPYVCQVQVTGTPTEAAMTLNVIARRTVPGGSVPVMEVHHLSVKNTAFAVSQKSMAASHHNVTDTPTPHK